MSDKIRVLVVDDSAFARATISSSLTTDPDIQVIGHAQDGIEAVEKTKELKPHVVTMDVIMPHMDGLAALEYIMLKCPTPVIMLSALTTEGADITVKALQLGAIDYFLKPSVSSPAGFDGAKELINKIRTAANARVSRHTKYSQEPAQFINAIKRSELRQTALNKVVVIGSSTGGPRALSAIVPVLPEDIPASVLIVQHMPPQFTKSLAERLDSISRILVKEAQDGDSINPGVAFLAPGGYHMIVHKNGKVRLNQGPTECGVRPSVNVTMESVASVYGASTLGVVLTGMGSDGTRGSSLIKAAKGRVIVEDESTCTVYGMPGSVVEAGGADKVVPLPEIASEIVKICNDKNDSTVATTRKEESLAGD